MASSLRVLPENEQEKNFFEVYFLNEIKMISFIDPEMYGSEIQAFFALATLIPIQR